MPSGFFGNTQVSTNARAHAPAIPRETAGTRSTSAFSTRTGSSSMPKCRKSRVGRAMSDPWGRLCDVRELVTSAAALPRLERARQWLRGQGPAARALVVAATQEAAAELVRAAAAEAGAAFGWQRFTLGRLAAVVAARPLAERGLSPLSPLGVEAVCARVVHQLRRRLGKLDGVAGQPGLPRALSRSLQELRMAGARPPGDLGRALEAYESELRRAGLADRAEVFRLALEANSELLALPAALLDLPLRSALEERFVARFCGPLLAVAPASDAEPLSRPLGVAARALEDTAETALQRVPQRP